MEEIDQPQPASRRLGGVLFVVALLVLAAATWGAVALASGSGSAPSTDSSTRPAANSFRGGQSIASPIASPGGGDRNCPEHDGGSTTPSAPSAPSSTDGSNNPTL